MLNNKVNFDDFEYVVERKKPDPICFGSKLERNTSPIGNGLSPFQKRCLPETYPKIGPGYYTIQNNSALDAVLNKIRSNKGVGPLASNVPRMKEKIYLWTPSPTKYSVKPDWGVKKEGKVPFGSKIKRQTFKEDKLPGPGTYNIVARKCRKTRFMYNFGHPTLIEAVEIICIPTPLDTCHKCKAVCVGDYWQKEYTLFLCQLCWDEEKKTQEIHNERELKQFKKMRNCSFMHQHEGVPAAIRLLPHNKITKKIKLESYLSLFIKC